MLCIFHHGSALTKLTSTNEDTGSIPASLNGLGIQHFCELWCRLQTQIRSDIAMAVVLLAAIALIQP